MGEQVATMVPSEFPHIAGEPDLDVKLFIGHLPKHWVPSTVGEIASMFGTVKEIILMKHPNSEMTKGCGFIKFAKFSQALSAIKHLHRNFTIDPEHGALVLRFADFELSRLGLPNSLQPDLESVRIFVGSIPEQFTETDVKGMFEPFGFVQEVFRMPKSRTPACFVIMADPQEAAAAIKALDKSPLLDPLSGQKKIMRVRVACTTGADKRKGGSEDGDDSSADGQPPPAGQQPLQPPALLSPSEALSLVNECTQHLGSSKDRLSAESRDRIQRVIDRLLATHPSLRTPPEKPVFASEKTATASTAPSGPSTVSLPAAGALPMAGGMPVPGGLQFATVQLPSGQAALQLVAPQSAPSVCLPSFPATVFAPPAALQPLQMTLAPQPPRAVTPTLQKPTAQPYQPAFVVSPLEQPALKDSQDSEAEFLTYRFLKLMHDAHAASNSPNAGDFAFALTTLQNLSRTNRELTAELSRLRSGTPSSFSTSSFSQHQPQAGFAISSQQSQQPAVIHMQQSHAPPTHTVIMQQSTHTLPHVNGNMLHVPHGGAANLHLQPHALAPLLTSQVGAPHI